jgi:hypothetical protein
LTAVNSEVNQASENTETIGYCDPHIDVNSLLATTSSFHSVLSMAVIHTLSSNRTIGTHHHGGIVYHILLTVDASHTLELIGFDVLVSPNHVDDAYVVALK